MDDNTKINALFTDVIKKTKENKNKHFARNDHSFSSLYFLHNFNNKILTHRNTKNNNTTKYKNT